MAVSNHAPHKKNEGRITYIGSGCEGEGVEAASTAEEADGECPLWPQDRGYS